MLQYFVLRPFYTVYCSQFYFYCKYKNRLVKHNPSVCVPVCVYYKLHCIEVWS